MVGSAIARELDADRDYRQGWRWVRTPGIDMLELELLRLLLKCRFPASYTLCFPADRLVFHHSRDTDPSLEGLRQRFTDSCVLLASKAFGKLFLLFFLRSLSRQDRQLSK